MLFSDAERWWIVGGVLFVEIMTAIFSISVLIVEENPLDKLLWLYGLCSAYILIMCLIISFVAKRRKGGRNVSIWQ